MKKKYRIKINYLPNYSMKYCFFNEPIKEDEGGGWYSIVGHTLVCSVSKVYKDDDFCTIDELPEEYRKLFEEERERYESTQTHQQRMKSFSHKYQKHEDTI